MTEACRHSQSTSRKRKPTIHDLPHNDVQDKRCAVEQDSRELAFQDKNEERIAALEEQIIASKKLITSLEIENSALKEANEAFQRLTSNLSPCELCDKVFRRSDGLRKHLREGDGNHRSLFTKRYKTECEECGITFKDCGAYNRHMRSNRHALHVLRSAKVSLSHACESRTTSQDDETITDSTINSDENETRTATFTDSRIARSPSTSFPTEPYPMSSKELAQTRTLPPLTFMSNQSLTVGYHSIALPALEDISHKPDQASGMVLNQSWGFGRNSVGQPHVEDISAASCQAYVAVDQSPVFEGNLVGNPLDYLSGFGMVRESIPSDQSNLRGIYSAESISQPLAQKDGAASDQSSIFLHNSVGVVFSHEIGHYLCQ